MQRGDVAVFSISAALAAVVVAAVTYSLLVLDRGSSAVVSQSSGSSWLVVTWGPSFCAAEPGNRVCESGEVQGMGQTLILHGLWPQPESTQYCGLPQLLADRARKDESDVPPLQLSDEVRTSLQSVMAGSATLAPHEWYAHGTCSGVTPDQYFGSAAALTAAARDVLEPLFRDADGGHIALSTVRARMDEQFGAGAGERVGFGCRKATGEGALVVEVRLSLPPVPALTSMTLGESLADAPPIDTACRHGDLS